MFGSGQRLGGDRSSYEAVEDEFSFGGFFQAGLVCVLLVLALIAGLAIESIGSVPPLHYGICYNHFTKSADVNKIYSPGRFFIGPFNRFLLFPSDVQSIEFTKPSVLRPAGVRYEPLHTRTKEGLGLHLQVSLQYRLMGEHIGRLYEEFNQNYEEVFTSSVRDILIKAASEYEAPQLWEERATFGDTMQRMVNNELGKAYAECWGLQLLVIDLPDDYEQSITRTQVQKQNLYMREQEQFSAKIRAETGVIEAEYSRKVKVILAQGEANYTVTTKEAEARAQQNKINVESQILGGIRTKLSFSPESLVTYQKYGALDELEEATLFFGFRGPSHLMIRPG